MLENYFPVLVLLAIAFGLGIVILAASYLAGIKRPNAVKRSQYECGFDPLTRIRLQFDVRYYLLAILFVVFDIEAAFLFPWAVAFRDIGFLGFVEMMLFLFILLVGYAYAWKKGALEWE
ncbi:MAG: NADH-quinone oxidoreductase subunit A [Magnetococcales bacterium]|nr:NADH-quinone oxidoreductase subunit A [Magnetococcales bacterium]